MIFPNSDCKHNNLLVHWIKSYTNILIICLNFWGNTAQFLTGNDYIVTSPNNYATLCSWDCKCSLLFVHLTTTLLHTTGAPVPATSTSIPKVTCTPSTSVTHAVIRWSTWPSSPSATANLTITPLQLKSYVLNNMKTVRMEAFLA